MILILFKLHEQKLFMNKVKFLDILLYIYYLLIQILFIIFVMFMNHEHDKYNEHI